MPGAKTTMSHWIGAETIGEKTQYMKVDDMANSATAWNPSFGIGIKSPVAATADNEYLVYYAIEWSFDVTFRGTRSQ